MRWTYPLSTVVLVHCLTLLDTSTSYTLPLPTASQFLNVSGAALLPISCNVCCLYMQETRVILKKKYQHCQTNQQTNCLVKPCMYPCVACGLVSFLLVSWSVICCQDGCMMGSPKAHCQKSILPIKFLTSTSWRTLEIHTGKLHK